MPSRYNIKQIREEEKKQARIVYETGKLYIAKPTLALGNIEWMSVDQPAELRHTTSWFKVYFNVPWLCVESGYLVDRPHTPSGTKWPINHFNGMTQGNLFLFDNKIFYIPIMDTYYNQRVILKEMTTE